MISDCSTSDTVRGAGAFLATKGAFVAPVVGVIGEVVSRAAQHTFEGQRVPIPHTAGLALLIVVAT